MAAKFSSQETDPAQSATAEAYVVSPSPIIPERNGKRGAHDADTLGLPRFYGLETLWLVARDPHCLFAYWDIDWQAAFAEENPRPRQVQLRVRSGDDSEQVTVEVEPMAGQCRVTVPKADAAYRAEIGFLNPAGTWTVVSRSETALVPPESESSFEAGDFATVPLHLSFQRMLDATRSLPNANDSLTATLAQLREHAARKDATLTASQREIVRALEQAAPRSIASTGPSDGPDLWAHHSLEKIFGFGNSSLSGGLGGSSRS